MRPHPSDPTSVFDGEAGHQAEAPALSPPAERAELTLTVPRPTEAPAPPATSLPAATAGDDPQGRDDPPGRGRPSRPWARLARVPGARLARVPWARLAWVPWPLFAVLAAQAGLSLSRVWSDTAYTDEALNLWAGHLEWAHWLHGAAIPSFPLYFPGAPVVYPPLGALADSGGGLAAARILSLVLMLGATALLWATASRLCSRRTAFFAAAVWAVLGSTIGLGAQATDDALSLFLMALAAWCVTRAGSYRHRTRWVLAGALALTAANAAKYGSVIFDPVVVALGVLAEFREPGRKTALAHAAAILTYVTAALILLVKIAGPAYLTGIRATTVLRKGGQIPAQHVLLLSWDWTGPLLVAAACGVALSLAGPRERHRTFLMTVLAGAALLAPALQMVMHTVTSLSGNVDYGLWFGAIAAGYAADRAAHLLRFRVLRDAVTGVCALALVALGWTSVAGALGLSSWPQASAFATTFRPLANAGAGKWPDAAAFVTAFRPLADSGTGRMLVENAPIAEYYLTAGRQWQRWSDTFSITTPSGRSVGYSTAGVSQSGNPMVYEHYVKSSYFSLIALNFTIGRQLDAKIATWLDHNPAYRVVMRVPYGRVYYIVWRRVTPTRVTATHVTGSHIAARSPR